jgi:predicted DCC family thiol-disulfide oxidoreductase YuxK
MYTLLFDGVCNLCNASVNFVINHDKGQCFQFAALQSETGKALLKSYGLSAEKSDSVVLLKEGKAFQKSDAALEIAWQLGGIWKLLAVFKVLPRPLRDLGYDLIARNRYRFFGRTEACRMPTPELNARFLS